MAAGNGLWNAMQVEQVAKSLKDQVRWQLWLAIATNIVGFYVVMQWDDISAAGIKALVTKSANLLPVGLTAVITTVINGLLSPDLKARIIFFRWRHALPGHRAFSEAAPKDPRIDMARLKKACGNKLPDDPAEQNQLWYRIYKTVEKKPAVEHGQRDFLLMRDYGVFAALSIFVFGIAALVVLKSTDAALIYIGVLIIQFILVRQAASNYGKRFVTTVLAEKSVGSAAPRAG